MKKQLSLSKFRNFHVWLNELPDCKSEAGEMAEIVVPAISRSLPAVKAAIELCIPVGPRELYGLLGGEFTPGGTTGELRVIARAGKTNDRMLSSALVSDNETIHVGLHAEYLDAIKQGVRLAREEITPAAGKLVINCCAYSETGSSSAVFKQLAIALVKLINSPAEGLTDEKIVSLLPQTIA